MSKHKGNLGLYEVLAARRAAGKPVLPASSQASPASAAPGQPPVDKPAAAPRARVGAGGRPLRPWPGATRVQSPIDTAPDPAGIATRKPSRSPYSTASSATAAAATAGAAPAAAPGLPVEPSRDDYAKFGAKSSKNPIAEGFRGAVPVSFKQASGAPRDSSRQAAPESGHRQAMGDASLPAGSAPPSAAAAHPIPLDESPPPLYAADDPYAESGAFADTGISPPVSPALAGTRKKARERDGARRHSVTMGVDAMFLAACVALAGMACAYALGHRHGGRAQAGQHSGVLPAPDIPWAVDRGDGTPLAAQRPDPSHWVLRLKAVPKNQGQNRLLDAEMTYIANLARGELGRDCEVYLFETDSLYHIAVGGGFRDQAALEGLQRFFAEWPGWNTDHAFPYRGCSIISVADRDLIGHWVARGSPL